MSNVKSLNFAKIGLALAVTVFAFAFAVSSALAAFTASQRAALEAAGYTDAQIDALDAILGGGEEASGSEDCGIEYTHSQTLAPGANGQVVANWQTFLNTYANATLSTDGVYGPATKSATMSFQSANGLSADGIVGPNTASAAADVQGDCPDEDDSDDSGDDTIECPAGYTCEKDGDDSDDSDNNALEGGAGSISSADFVNTLNNEEVGEGEDDKEVAGLEIEASEGSDIRLRAVNIDFDQAGSNAANSDFNKYADEVSVWFDGEEVARVDANSFHDDNGFQRTVSLDSSKTIIRADEEERLVIAVSGLSNIDSNDTTETWTVQFFNVRYEDAQGAIITETGQEDIGTETREFSFEDFASASNTELKIKTSSNDPESSVIDVDDTNTTDDVEVFVFNAEVKGSSDLELDDVDVEATLGGSATNVNDVASSVYLYMDGNQVGSETAPASTTVTFDDLNLDLNDGQTYEFAVRVDFLSTNDSLADGDTIAFKVTSTEINNWDVEDASGDNLANSDKTGAANGDSHAAYAAGVDVQFVSSSQDRSFVADASGENDRGEYKIKFDVNAFDDTFYIDQSCEEGGADAAGQGVEYTITNSGSNTLNCLLAAAGSESGDNSNVFEVPEGETRSFTLTVSATATADHFAEVALESVNWGSATDDTNANYYTFNLDDFETDSIFLNSF